MQQGVERYCAGNVRGAIAPNLQQPDWVQAHNARDLLAPLLASAWDDSCQGDRWSRVAQVLRDVAESYSSYAAHKDQRAELTQDVWH